MCASGNMSTILGSTFFTSERTTSIHHGWLRNCQTTTRYFALLRQRQHAYAEAVRPAGNTLQFRPPGTSAFACTRLCLLQVLCPSRTVTAYVKAPEDGAPQRQQQPWEQASSSGGGGSGRFSAYIQNREGEGQSQSNGGSWRNGSGSNGASNGASSEGGGRFAAYIRDKEGHRGQSSSSSWGEQAQQQNGSAAGQDGGRFAKYYQR